VVEAAGVEEAALAASVRAEVFEAHSAVEALSGFVACSREAR